MRLTFDDGPSGYELVLWELDPKDPSEPGTNELLLRVSEPRVLLRGGCQHHEWDRRPMLDALPVVLGLRDR